MNANHQSRESLLSLTLKFVLQVVAVMLLVLLLGWGLMRIASWSASRAGGDAAGETTTVAASGSRLPSGT